VTTYLLLRVESLVKLHVASCDGKLGNKEGLSTPLNTVAFCSVKEDSVVIVWTSVYGIWVCAFHRFVLGNSFEIRSVIRMVCWIVQIASKESLFRVSSALYVSVKSTLMAFPAEISIVLPIHCRSPPFHGLNIR